MNLSNYINLTNELMNGSITQAAVGTYTVAIGAWAWFLAIFITMIAVYIKSQSTGTALIIGLLFFTVAQTFIGIVGNTVFYTLIVIGLAILLFKWWRG
jgi:hypothetical protein